MLGIIIGIAAIIAIVSTIRGTNEEIKNNLIGSGNNTVKVVLSQGGYEYTMYDGMSMPDGIPQVSDATRKKILDLDEVESVTAYNSRYLSNGIFYQNKPLSDLYIYGIDPYYFSTCNYIVKTGRAFLDSDYEQFRKVVIMDAKAAKTLFGDANPLGRTVEVSQEPFTVVGIVEERVKFEPEISSISDYYEYASDSNGMVYIPKASWPITFNYDEPENVIVKAVNTDSMSRAGQRTAQILNDTITNTSSSIKYMGQDLLSRAASLQSLSNATNQQLLWIAGISLLVGGIGVMNIMLVSVTERTNEIGLKKAIGARKRTILGQFLTEAAVLTSIGGVLGVASGYGAAQVIHRISGVAVAIDVPYSILAVGVSMGIGLIFGFFPSIRAANMDPIEALRRE